VLSCKTHPRTGKKRWKQCIDSEEEYIEEDKLYLLVSLSINILKRKFGMPFTPPPYSLHLILCDLMMIMMTAMTVTTTAGEE
jgi:hypothetical protein